MERWCWINLHYRGVLLIWIRVGQGPTALAVSAGGGCFDIFCSRLSFLFSFSLSLGNGCWLVGCFKFNGPLRHISVYIGPSPKEREKEERKDR